MTPIRINPACCVKGKISLPGDKSIAHRALIISAIAKGKTLLKNFPANDDCRYTLKAFKSLGIKIKNESASEVRVFGRGLFGLIKPKGPIFVGESGTTLRLLAGVLSGQNFVTKLTSGKSLSRRPMSRVAVPLRKMGAQITARIKKQDAKQEEYPPLVIQGGGLKPAFYKMPVASAQVKSAILLAGLYVEGETRVREAVATRDHTERMLKLFKARIYTTAKNIVLGGNRELTAPGTIYIPGDVSSASFFMAGAALLPGSRLLIQNIGLNPSRMGAVRVLKRMGAKIKVKARRQSGGNCEPMGDVLVEGGLLEATTVHKDEIPSLIDELPILMVAACYARGRTLFENAGELRVKESDRIRSISENLMRMGAKIRVVKGAESEDIIIQGGKKLKGVKVKSFNDHRTAMSMAIAGLLANGATLINDSDCVKKSFPGFFKMLEAVTWR